MNYGLIGSGCFGKRPPAGDYIHHHRGGAAILEWQAWIQDGVGLASARFGGPTEQLLREIGPFQFAYPASRSESYLFGALGPGEDRSGRVFPFTVFVEVQPDPAESTADLVHRFGALRDRATEIVVGREESLDALFAAVDGLADGVPPPLPSTAAAEYLATEAVAALTTGREGSLTSAALVRVTRNLLRVAQRAARDRQLPNYALRFPLPADRGEGTAARVAFLAMVQRAFGAKLRPALWWSADYPEPATEGRHRFLSVYPASVGPAGFLHLVEPSSAGETLFSLDDETPEPNGGGVAGNAEEACWSDPRMSLKEAVDRNVPESRRRRL